MEQVASDLLKVPDPEMHVTSSDRLATLVSTAPVPAIIAPEGVASSDSCAGDSAVTSAVVQNSVDLKSILRQKMLREKILRERMLAASMAAHDTESQTPESSRDNFVQSIFNDFLKKKFANTRQVQNTSSAKKQKSAIPVQIVRPTNFSNPGPMNHSAEVLLDTSETKKSLNYSIANSSTTASPRVKTKKHDVTVKSKSDRVVVVKKDAHSKASKSSKTSNGDNSKTRLLKENKKSRSNVETNSQAYRHGLHVVLPSRVRKPIKGDDAFDRPNDKDKFFRQSSFQRPRHRSREDGTSRRRSSSLDRRDRQEREAFTRDKQRRARAVLERAKHRYRRSRSKSPKRRRRHRSRSPSPAFDAEKMKEIARMNMELRKRYEHLTSRPAPGSSTISLISSGKRLASIVTVQQEVIPTRDRLQELTDYCRQITELEQLTKGLEEDGERENNGDGKSAKTRAVKASKSTTHDIKIRITDAKQLPARSAAELQLQSMFPVSSGMAHTVAEREDGELMELEEPTSSSASTKQKMLPTSRDPGIQILLKRRSDAVKALRANPTDYQALLTLEECDAKVAAWAKGDPGPAPDTQQQQALQMAAAGLPMPRPAPPNFGTPHARVDSLRTGVQITGGIGKHLLEKMGWKDGEGIGKNVIGAFEPMMPDLKLNRRGLATVEEGKTKRKTNKQLMDVEIYEPGCAPIALSTDKHPVSLLNEVCAKHHWMLPQYALADTIGPPHNPHFLFSAMVNGCEYRASTYSKTKKESKTLAAIVALQALGVFNSNDVLPTAAYVPEVQEDPMHLLPIYSVQEPVPLYAHYGVADQPPLHSMPIFAPSYFPRSAHHTGLGYM